MGVRKHGTGIDVRYVVRYRDPTGRQVSKSFRTKHDAEHFDSAERTRIRRGEWVDSRLAATKFSEWAEEWLKSNPTKQGSTRRREEGIVRLHFNPHIGNVAINQLGPLDVQKMVSHWSANGSSESVGRYYRTLSSIFRYAINCDLIVRSPCRGIKLPKSSRKTAQLVTGDEIDALAAALGNHSLMAYLGAFLGLRWGEAAGLQVKHIDTKNSRIRIEQGVARDYYSNSILAEPKTFAGIRTLTMSLTVADRVAEYLDSHNLHEPNQLLFSNRKGELLRYSNWSRRIWKPACVKIGRESLGFHDLRRTNATAMVASGIDIKTAQYRLGHADPRMTLAVYAQATSEGENLAATRLEDHLLKTKVQEKCSSSIGDESAEVDKGPTSCDDAQICVEDEEDYVELVRAAL